MKNTVKAMLQEVLLKQCNRKSNMPKSLKYKKPSCICLILQDTWQSFPYKNHSKCYKTLVSRSWPVIFTFTYFFPYTYTFRFCCKIKSCCDRCFPQQIRPQITVQSYITRLFQCENWFQYDKETPHIVYSIHHVSLNLLSFDHYCFTQS